MPDPIFTFHSAIRLMERGITRDHILAAVNFGRIIQSYDGKIVYALERLRVVAVENNVIVTAWREQKENEKRKIRKARAAQKKHKRRWG